MSVDPRSPVIVGAGQVTHRDEAVEPSPLALMVEAARRAAEDCARPALLERAGSVAAVEVVSWPVPDPARAVAGELGLSPAETVRSARGGSGPAQLLGDLASRIAGGEVDVALIVGGEAFNPFLRATREGRETGWPHPPGAPPPARVVGEDRPPGHDAETAAGLLAPISYYPLFESAVRGAAGRDPDAHRAWLGRLWARLAEVARGNPHAWWSDPPGAEQIADPSPANRMVAFPYPKLMTANIQVDQGAALLLSSAGAAEAAGVPRERWTFVHATAEAHDHWFAAERDRLHRSPALAACGRAVLEHGAMGVDDLSHLDLYSCFPSAVEVAATELGVDLETDDRPPTVTGGLTFAGGPANNYVTHSLAALCDRLRETGGLGLATGVGWYLTKHATVLLGARPPRRPFRHHRMQAEVDPLPGRAVASGEAVKGGVEAYTAIYDRAGEPTLGIVSCLLDDGRRALAGTEDAPTIAALLAGDPLGAPAALGADGGWRLLAPERAGAGAGG